MRKVDTSTLWMKHHHSSLNMRTQMLRQIYLPLLFVAYIANMATAYEQVVNCRDYYNLHDCDPQAICVSIPSQVYSYQSTAPTTTCRCPNGYIDASPNKARAPGRKCTPPPPSGCGKCSPNADCHVDVVHYSGVTCTCKPGFVDASPNGYKEPGMVCNQIQSPRNDRCDPGKNDCDRNAICYTRGANDYTCACKGGFRDKSPQPGVFPGRVCEQYAPKCLDPTQNTCDKPDRAICTDLADNNYTCKCRTGFRDTSPQPATQPGRVCEPLKNPCADGTHNCSKEGADCLYDGAGGYTCRCKSDMIDQSPNVTMEPGRVCVAKHIDTPPLAMQSEKSKCGNSVCNETLGEVCKKGQCVCPANFSRSDPSEKCVPVVETPLAVRVGQLDGKPITYTIADYGDKRNPVYTNLSDTFGSDTSKALNTTSYGPSLVNTQVRQLSHPRAIDKTWNDGVLVNFTVNTLASAGRPNVCDMWDKLVDAIKQTDGAIGGGSLKVSPELEKLDPCLRSRNECELNSTICPLNTRCVDLEIGYKCVCMHGFIDATPKNDPHALTSPVCKPDFCSDVQYCKVNSTCINDEEGYHCVCKPGFVDVSQAATLAATSANSSSSNRTRRAASNVTVDDSTCLHASDVDPCALGLHNCSAAAICIPLHPGYKCQCPAGWVDGDPSNPGHHCAQALCGACNNHGTCVTDPVTGNVTCICTDGYHGDHCELTASKLPIILLIILALLFLILALCCLLYLCSRCRCFRRRRGLLDETPESSIYDQMRIPRAHLYDADSLKSGSSEYTIREDVERRVTTDVTRTEMHSGGADGNHEVMDKQHAWQTRYEFYPHDYTERTGSPKPPRSV